MREVATRRQVNGRLGNAYRLAGEIVPPLTNAEVVAIVEGVLADLGKSAMPLWYQYAAAAYGWAPPGVVLDASPARGAALFDPELTRSFWVELDNVQMHAADNDDLDAAPGPNAVPSPRLDLDASFTNPVIMGEVGAALGEDGAKTLWKIPLPACKDPKTGKPVGRPHRAPDGKWTCDPVLIDDPITAVANSVMPLVLVVGALWLLTRD